MIKVEVGGKSSRWRTKCKKWRWPQMKALKKSKTKRTSERTERKQWEEKMEVRFREVEKVAAGAAAKITTSQVDLDSTKRMDSKIESIEAQLKFARKSR